MINETWLNNHSPPLPPIPGYKFVGKPRVDRKGGGVGFLIRDDVIFRRKENLEINSKTFENIVIEIKCKTNLLLCSGYRPPNTDLPEFLTSYNKMVNNLEASKHSESIIGIDHNLDFIKQHLHNPTKMFIESNIESNMLPTITRPTRITNTSATLIDNLFISQQLQTNYKSGILLDDTSDHMPCYLILPDATNYKKPLREVQHRNLSEKNKRKICDLIESIDWDTKLQTLDTNSAFDEFHKHLTMSIDSISPIVTKKINPKKQPRAKWITTGILNSINKNLMLYKESIKINATPDQQLKYNTHNKLLKKIQRLAKMRYYTNKCEEIKTNGSKLWRLINKITNKASNKQTVINRITVDEIVHERPKTIANELAKYFANIGDKLSNTLPKPKQTVNAYLNKIPRCPNTMYATPTTPTEIDKIIRKLANKSSSGYDQISNQMLKWLRPVITVPLCIIYNKSLQEGCFPDKMKLAEVVPVHKGGDESISNNYRPISLLITISKILEKIIYARTYQFLEKNNILFKSQYGFRNQHSCNDAISELVGEITKNKERCMHTAGIFLDLSKAFDTLPHAILLNKLEKYGIRGTMQDWFMSYLKTRTLRVKCNVASSNIPIKSDLYKIGIGTPQGSCLGPLLFLLYNNDLYLHLEHTKVILFADDTTIYMGHRNLSYLKWCMEQDLIKIRDWFLANKLTLNLKKSCLVLFKKSKKTESIPIQFHDIEIPRNTRVKFLGIWLDENLDWTFHCNAILKKIKKNKHLLKMGQNYLTQHALKLIYHAHVQSHAQYGLLIWGNQSNARLRNNIQKQLDRSIDIVNKGKYPLAKTNFLDLSNLIKLENYKLGYKLINDMLPEKLSADMSVDKNNNPLHKQHKYDTRNKNQLNIPKHDSSSYHNSFLCASIRDYSTLPHSITSSASLHTFMVRCKRYLTS